MTPEEIVQPKNAVESRDVASEFARAIIVKRAVRREESRFFSEDSSNNFYFPRKFRLLPFWGARQIHASPSFSH